MPKYLDEPGLTRFYDNIADRPVYAFDTVAEMQAAMYLQDGMTCHTNGFHASDDGGAAYYTVSASGTANDMDVLALQGGLFATLVVTEPYVTPEMFGAHGDGTHDDTDSLAQMFKTEKPCRLVNSYLYTSALDVLSDISGGGTVVHGADGIYLAISTDNVTVDGVKFDINGHSHVAIRVSNGANNVHITNCEIFDAGSVGTEAWTGGIYANWATNLHIDGCYIHDCICADTFATFGISIEGNSKNIFIENSTIENVFGNTDSDGIKIMTNADANAHFVNNVFKNCQRRCIKIRSTNVHSMGNTFVYQDVSSIDLFAVEFQSGHSDSINDRLVFIITDASIATRFNNVYGVEGPNVTIDGFSTDLQVPDGYTFTALAGSCLVRIENFGEQEKNIDNLTLSNIVCEGMCAYLVGITSGADILSANNMRVSNVRFSRNTVPTIYSAFNILGFQSIINCITIDNFCYTGTPDVAYALMPPAVSTPRLIVNNVQGATPLTYYKDGNIEIDTGFGDNGSQYLKGYRQSGKNVEILYNATANPTGITYSSYQLARNTPVGAKLLFQNPIYDSNAGTMQIGYICTVAGTTSAVGTFVPLYASI